MLMAAVVLILFSVSADCNKKSNTKPTIQKPQSTQKQLIDRSGRVSGYQPLVSRGLSMVGTKYRWGGASYKGVDCSGLMVLLYKKEGIKLPHSSKQQYKLGKPVKKSELIAGDLLFFNTRGSISHVGMYIGNDKFVHATNRSKGVRVNKLSEAYYKKRFVGARRILKAS